MKTLLAIMLIFAMSTDLMAQKKKKAVDDVYETSTIKNKKQSKEPISDKTKGTKLFGDIYSGMTKGEFRSVLNSNKEGQTMKISGQIIEPSVGFSTFDENKKIVRLAMVNVYDWRKMMTDNRCTLFLINLDSVIIATGFECSYKNSLWPKALLMSGKTVATYIRSDKVIDILLSETTITYIGTIYSAYLYITTPENVSKKNNVDMKNLDSEINEAKEKL